eukprot:8202242-Alexandrium_andersonii.AAC.1
MDAKTKTKHIKTHWTSNSTTGHMHASRKVKTQKARHNLLEEGAGPSKGLEAPKAITGSGLV